jgi:hypothetical protein
MPPTIPPTIAGVIDLRDVGETEEKRELDGEDEGARRTISNFTQEGPLNALTSGLS